MAFIGMRISPKIPRMPLHRRGLALFFACLIADVFALGANPQRFPPAASGARTLLMPRRIVSGERATPAVLDVKLRLAPGVTVDFSHGDGVTTASNGRD